MKVIHGRGREEVVKWVKSRPKNDRLQQGWLRSKELERRVVVGERKERDEEVLVVGLG